MIDSPPCDAAAQIGLDSAGRRKIDREEGPMWRLNIARHWRHPRHPQKSFNAGAAMASQPSLTPTTGFITTVAGPGFVAGERIIEGVATPTF